MRKIFITIALFAVLGTLAVSCQKENIIDDTCVVAENGTDSQEFTCIKE